MAEHSPSSPDFARQLAGVVHDLRQPLDALAIYAEMLSADPSQAGELAPRMLRAVASAQGLARSLQDFAALRAHGAMGAPAAVHVPALLADLAAIHEPLARQKGLEWRVHPLDVTLHTDAGLLRRLLGNLLANAARYTERGGVLLAARRREGGLAFEVWDTGRGVARADQQRVFEPFVRLGGTEESDGAGLGLAVVRELADQLGGTLALRSQPGRGSVFRVTFNRSSAGR